MYFGTTPSVISHVRSGKLCALGVTSIKRSKSIPDIPTISEAGLAGFHQTTWQGLFVPAGTPKPVIAKLSAETMRVMRLPEVEERLISQGVDAVASSPDEFSAFVKQEVAKYEKLVKVAKLKVE
jgi:tripartite-type tricarboxylate transporter receptor subunit TctC